MTTSDTRSPLRRLWAYSGGHRRTVVAAVAVTVLNKLADVMPELLIGAAVDVVVPCGARILSWATCSASRASPAS